jgi:spore cortex formation protein SpoVR/YcgB (stage V sporulation)
MFLSFWLVFLFTLRLSSGVPEEGVPGLIAVRLSFEPISRNICPGDIISYTVSYKGVPEDHPHYGDTYTEVEVRTFTKQHRELAEVVLSPRKLRDFVESDKGVSNFTVPANYAGNVSYFSANVFYNTFANNPKELRNVGTSLAFKILSC